MIKLYEDILSYLSKFIAINYKIQKNALHSLLLTLPMCLILIKLISFLSFSIFFFSFFFSSPCYHTISF